MPSYRLKTLATINVYHAKIASLVRKEKEHWHRQHPEEASWPQAVREAELQIDALALPLEYRELVTGNHGNP